MRLRFSDTKKARWLAVPLPAGLVWSLKAINAILSLSALRKIMSARFLTWVIFITNESKYDGNLKYDALVKGPFSDGAIKISVCIKQGIDQ
jgi:hypothetical protein